MANSASTPAPISGVAAAQMLGVAYFRRLMRPRKLLLPLGVIVTVWLVLGIIVGAAGDGVTGEIAVVAIRELVFGFVTPFVALYYGIAVVSDEVEDGTLAWILMRPVSRRAFLVGRAIAAVAMAVAVQLPLLIALPWLLSGGDVPSSVEDALLRGPLVAAVGTMVYAAVYVLLSVVFRRGFLIGLLHLGLFEFMLGLMPGRPQFVTIRAHLYNLLGVPPDQNMIQRAIPVHLDASVSMGVLVAVLIIAMALALAVFERREFIERNEPEAV